MRAKKLIESLSNQTNEQIGMALNKPSIAIIEKLVKENWSKDADSMKDSMAKMNELCSMHEEEEVQKFMEYMDKASSDYKMDEKK